MVKRRKTLQNERLESCHVYETCRQVFFFFSEQKENHLVADDSVCSIMNCLFENIIINQGITLPCWMKVSKYCSKLAFCRTLYNCSSDTFRGWWVAMATITSFMPKKSVIINDLLLTFRNLLIQMNYNKKVLWYTFWDIKHAFFFLICIFVYRNLSPQ